MATALKARPPASDATDIDLEAYFARIGYRGPQTPTLKTLCAIAERQIATIPFENFDVLLGRGVSLEPVTVDAKLLQGRRGGYCFELNGLLRRALLALGFEVTGLAARVRWQLPDDASPTPRSHMVLKVVVDGEAWLVDVGFGRCTPTSPLNLRSRARQRTTHEAFRLNDGLHGTQLQAQAGARWMPVYDFTEEPQLDADYAVYNWHTSTHPDSHFQHTLIVALTTSEVRWTLRDNRLTVRRADGMKDTRLLDAAGIKHTLTDIFGLTVEPAWHELIARRARGDA